MNERLVSLMEALKNQKAIYILTSGGTQVGLNSAYALENFSTGTRGSKLAECFCENKQYIIYLCRKGSVLPFERREKEANHEDLESYIYKAKKKLKYVVFEQFELFSEYEAKLRGLCQLLQKELPQKPLLIISSAAVSDFNLPAEDQRQFLAPKEELKMEKTKNSLKELAQQGCQIISFKLETDQQILEKKSLESFDKYGSKMVIGNLLQSRYEEIFIYFKDKVEHVKNDPSQRNHLE